MIVERGYIERNRADFENGPPVGIKPNRIGGLVKDLQAGEGSTLKSL